MSISATKSSYLIFTKCVKKPNLKLTLYNNHLPETNSIKFLGITLDNKLSFKYYIDEICEKCNSRLNLIKILSNRSWGLNQPTLSTLYKTLIGSIIDYAFPCLNLLSNESIRKLQVIQNTAIRRILKLKLETPLETLHHLAFQKLTIHRVDNRLFDLSESYFRNGLKNFTPLVIRLVKEYKSIFSSREISNLATPLCSQYLTIDEIFPSNTN